MDRKVETKQRENHKRRSGIQDYNVQSVQRRTSKRASSNYRHGQVYPDGLRQEVVPSVSVEDPPRPDPDWHLSDSGIPLSRSSTPQPPARRNHHSRPREAVPHSYFDGPPSSDRDVTPSHSHSRPRTRTLEEQIRKKSPTLVPKTRQHPDSRNTSQISDVNDDAPSIGYPSVEPSPPLELQVQSRRRRNHRSHTRTLSPIKNPISTNRNNAPSSVATDAGKISQLMKTTCGRMHGILSYRTLATGTWMSGYCAINVASGSLIYQAKGDVRHAQTLVSDLRGCQVRTLHDEETHSIFLEVFTRANSGIHLRPHVPETFDSWLAALLCWQPVKPKGTELNEADSKHLETSSVEEKPATSPKPLVSGPRQRTPSYERRLGDRRRNSESLQHKDASIIKVGKMLMWDKDARSGESSSLHNRRGSIYKVLNKSKTKLSSWRRVSCTLQENGHFKFYTDSPDTVLHSVVPLSQLSRCAVQRLDPSVLDAEFSIAIYPQYSSSPATVPSIRPIYLAMDSRILFEVWFVLLRAFTIPDLYGPEQMSAHPPLVSLRQTTGGSKTSVSEMFRVERHLFLRIIEAKLHSNRGKHSQGFVTPSRQQNAMKKDMVAGNYYAEVLLDGEVRAKTAVKLNTSNPFWREDFEFVDLPPVLSTTTSIDIKTQNPSQRDWTLVSQTPPDARQGNLDPLAIVGDIEVSPLDLKFGKVELQLGAIEKATDTERWWPIKNDNDDVVGELLMKARLDELVVLTGRDYQSLSELLHTFSNGLTNQIAQVVHPELRLLSEILLNIFQVSGQASEWIMSLVEDEIDNIHKETPVSKFRYGRRIASNDSFESGVEREMLLRDMGKSATVEANLLFRGNSLLTKALDLHMRRLGKEYLEDTLSEMMRDIDESDPECEVDPNKVQNPEDLKRNWGNLIALTENVWRSIVASAVRCPPELRTIFRHIRACADDRYGDFLRTVSYSSVSGFLFLRFFCPAVLNPKLFGLIKDHPRPRAHRTLTLITKTLQTLANLTTFGSKEPWMEPMNQFLHSHRQEFREFVDAICTINPDRAGSTIPPSYATPITILGRLPATNCEGFPSLPYLIDQARECACLVTLWLEARNDIESSTSLSDDLRRFNLLCEHIYQTSKDRLSLAENSDRQNKPGEPKWRELVWHTGKARIRSQNGRITPGALMFRKDNSSASTMGDSSFSETSRQQSPTTFKKVVPLTIEQSGLPAAINDAESSENEMDAAPMSSSGVSNLHSQRDDEEAPSKKAVKDDDEDSVEVPATVGGSMYSLNTTQAPTLPRPPRNNHHHRSRRDKPAKSSYSLTTPGSSDQSSATAAASRSTPSQGSGHTRDRTPSSGGTGKSVYRLKDLAAENGLIGVRSSPASRDGPTNSIGGGGVGMLRVGDLGSLFKRKTKEKDDPWKG